MLKKYKNGFIEIIKKNGFDPRCFKVSEHDEDGYDVFVLELKNSPFQFSTCSSANSFHMLDCEFTLFAANFPMSDVLPEINFTTIEGIYEYFEEWIKSHVKEYLDELTCPDLWQQIEKEEPLITASILNQDDLSLYSDNQKAQMRLSIDDFNLLIIKTFKPDLTPI